MPNGVGKTAGDRCTNALRMVNLTSENMEGFFEIDFRQDGNIIWEFAGQGNFELGPHGLVTTPSILALLIPSVALTLLYRHFGILGPKLISVFSINQLGAIF